MYILSILANKISDFYNDNLVRSEQIIEILKYFTYILEDYIQWNWKRTKILLEKYEKISSFFFV